MSGGQILDFLHGVLIFKGSAKDWIKFFRICGLEDCPRLGSTSHTHFFIMRFSAIHFVLVLHDLEFTWLRSEVRKGRAHALQLTMAARARIVESYVQNSEDYSEFRCGARTRTGRPCKRLPVPGGKRCPNHGGRSTGPRTPEGRARIAAAQRERWLKWRMQKLRDASTQS
jgi:hypothetical protein